jgi:hypothetical protein
MKTREEIEVKLNAVLTSTKVGDSWQVLCLGHYDPGEMDAGTHRIAARVGAGSGLNAVARKVSWLSVAADTTALAENCKKFVNWRLCSDTWNSSHSI